MNPPMIIPRALFAQLGLILCVPLGFGQQHGTAIQNTHKSLDRVGGVEFSQVAVLDGMSMDASLSLTYLPFAKDGSRLEITLEGEIYRPEIPDWQLIPIANFVESGQSTAVSFFYNNLDPNNSSVIYHPAFAGNLAGLRLYQAGMMLNRPEKQWELPSSPGGQYFGLGESKPKSDPLSLLTYQSIGNTLERQLQSLGQAQGGTYSCTLSDFQEPIVLLAGCDSMRFSGKPYFLFHKTSPKGFLDSLRACIDRIYNSPGQVDQNLLHVCTQMDESLESIKWAQDSARIFSIQAERLREAFRLGQISETSYQTQLKAIEYKHALVSDRYLKKIKRLETFLTDENTSAFFNSYPMARSMARLSVVSPNTDLTYLIRHLYRDMLWTLNPAVMKTAERTMHYSALFRIVKNESPENWELFLSQLSRRKNELTYVPTPMTYEGGSR